MNRLAEIVEQKRRRVAAAKELVPIDLLRRRAEGARKEAKAHALRSALLNKNRVNIIAEFKRRSPSKGAIKAGADPVLIAREYEAGGAIAISVLTEEDYFEGSLDDLRAVRETTSLPILRKDFVFDPYQVYESAAAGADALLLIVASLDDDDLKQLCSLIEDELAMDALVEAHTREEMRRAVECSARLIGVNNRNLATFEVSLDTSIELAALAPAGTVLISESGIERSDDVERLREAGYRGFLIGETLMKSNNPRELLREFSQVARINR